MVNILNPVSGKVVKAKKIKDPTFGEEMMGKTLGIIPSDKKFFAPVDGKLILVEDHAFSIETKEKVQILVHIGIDTVNIDPKLKKKIFSYQKKKGDKIKAGELLLNCDIDQITDLGYDNIVSIIVLSDSVKDKEIEVLDTGKLAAQTPIFSVN